MVGFRKITNLLADVIDRISLGAGRLTSFLVLVCILVIAVSVVLRYFFSRTYVALDEIQYYCYSVMFLFGFSYVYKEDGHIRVDILNARLSKRKKNLIDLLGSLFLTIPWTATISYYSYKYFIRSYRVSERSTEVTGLPAIYILKFILFLAFVLLTLQGVSKAIRSFNLLFTRVEE